VRWRSGTVGANGADEACGTPIVLQIDSAAYSRASSHALAYATPYVKSGTCIHVFMDRVAKGRNLSFETALLAHVLAHEITHVLQQTEHHSSDGVMKAVWSSDDYASMETPRPSLRS
jgi:hypothetical protein